MKFTHLEIDRFGVWRELSLPLTSPFFNVVYGPNEAGKTTLMRFLRGMLYGFSTESLRQHEQPSGMLEVEHHGNDYLIQREGTELSISGARELHGVEAETFLNEMLGGLTRETFDGVCCFGLDELQKLSVLTGEEIVEKLFGVSLGPQGRFVVGALGDSKKRREQLTRGNERKKSLRRLLSEHDRITAELTETSHSREQLNTLKQQLVDLDQQIASLQQRRDGVDEERRGHLYLQQVHAPWLEVRGLQNRLNEIPKIDTFPERGVQRLDEIEESLAELTERRLALKAQQEQGERELRQLRKSFPLSRHLPAIKLLLQQQRELRPQLDAVDALRTRTKELGDDLNRKRNQLGSGWSLERVQNLDLSPAKMEAFNLAADNYRQSLRRRARARKVINRLSRRLQQEQVELTQQTAGWHGQSAAQVLSQTQRLLCSARDRERLALKREQLVDRLAGLREQQQSLLHSEPLPKGARYLLTGFAIFGVILAMIGIWKGVTASGLAGVLYALLGITCGSLGLALKWHFRSELQQHLHDLDEQTRKIELELRELDEQITLVNNQVGAKGETDLTQLTEQFQTISACVSREERLLTDRKRASQLRSRLQELRRDVSLRRDEWVQCLRQLGLTETVKTEDARQEWKTLAALSAQVHRLGTLQSQTEAIHDVAGVFESSVRDVQKQINSGSENQPIDKILKGWEEQLHTWEHSQSRYKELQQQRTAIRKQRGELKKERQQLRGQRSTLLSEGKARDRKTFDQHAEWFLERRELRELLSEAQRELELAASTETDLAIVEEDLEAFDFDANQLHLDVLTREGETLRRELEEAYDLRGRRREQLQTLQTDHRQLRLRQELAELEAQIASQSHRWLGLESATRSVRSVKEKLEREQRPETLQRAEHYFRQLTAGRYQRVWAPLGEQDVHVEDHTGLARTLNELSGGTREQLLLALRFALLEEQRQRGIDLPFILDDILVNFDETRVRSAIDTLGDFAAGGSQVILLTCHHHLAKQMRERNLPVTDLPDRSVHPERLAG